MTPALLPPAEPLSADPQRHEYPNFSSLVSLRFFAAISIAFAHTLGSLVLKGDYLLNWGFSSLMIFFHVLSGFTLAYVYPTLETRAKVVRFWVARVGRVWPVHVGVIAAVILCFWGVQPFDKVWWCELASNLTMTQSWLPYANAQGAFNGPAWSISTEFGLYLLFPLLIRNFSRTWHYKLVAAFCLALGTTCFCFYCDNHPAFLLSKLQARTIVYVHPFMRMLEFVIGMSLSLLWTRSRGRIKMGAAAGTIMEAGALAFCVAAMLATHPVALALNKQFHIGFVGTSWVERILFPLIPFAVLVFVFSLNKGAISLLLGRRVFVFLGDLSFSIYLIHAAMIHGFVVAAHSRFSSLPLWATVTAFWCCVLLTAWTVYRLWEQPCRAFFRRLLPPLASSANQAPNEPAASQPLARRPAFWPSPALQLIGALSLMAVIWCDDHLHPHVQLIDAGQADKLAAEGMTEIRDLKFGDRFMLKAFVPHWSDNGLQVDIVWQSLRNQSLVYNHAVHFVDKKGALMGGADYQQDANQAYILKGTIWLDQLTFSKSQLEGVNYLGIGIYKPGGALLPVSGGDLDWNGGRLLINIANRIIPPVVASNTSAGDAPGKDAGGGPEETPPHGN